MLKKKKRTAKLPMKDKVRKGFMLYSCIVLAMALICCTSITAFAAGDDPLTVVNNLSDFIFGLIRAVGLILLGWGIVQVGLSLQSHDPSQRSNGFLSTVSRVGLSLYQRGKAILFGNHRWKMENSHKYFSY